MKLDSDFELPKKRQKKSTGKQIPSMLYPVSKGSPPPYKVRKVKTTHMLRMEIMLTKFPLQHQFLRQQKTFYHLVMCACARNLMSCQQKGLQGHLRVPFVVTDYIFCSLNYVGFPVTCEPSACQRYVVQSQPPCCIFVARFIAG